MNKTEDRRTENCRSEKGEANKVQGQHRRNSKAGAAQRSRRRMIICVVIAMVLVLALFLYILGERYFRTHYVWGTTVNGDSVAGMTVEEVQASLLSEIDDYTLVITERTGDGGTTEETITGAEIGLTLTFDDSLEEALEAQADGGWLMSLGTKTELEISTMVEYNETAWEQKMDSLQCFQDDFVTKPEDAYLSEYQEGVGYEIVEAVAGNQTNQSKVIEILAEAVLNLEETITLE
ncbi:MAG: peptidoglycan binding domain-containing protein, partial [Clostridiales bacterium]|nr:peptidoglycan binding domain-containing protein [Clostridiales bacterium]